MIDDVSMVVISVRRMAPGRLVIIVFGVELLTIATVRVLFLTSENASKFEVTTKMVMVR